MGPVTLQEKLGAALNRATRQPEYHGVYLSILPASITNEKGTKFFLTIKTYELKASKGWQVSYVYTGARAVVRKGYPVIKADTLPEALESMLTWFNDNHSEQLNWD